MPSFDIVSEIERMEIENAVNQAVKELATRFDFKGSSAKIELTKPELITLSAEDANKLKGVREIMVGKLAKRGVPVPMLKRPLAVGVSARWRVIATASFT